VEWAFVLPFAASWFATGFAKSDRKKLKGRSASVQIETIADRRK
jgi:hypothetical protein